MLKFIPVKCAGCGGNLDITPEMENFSCGYCGTAQVVQRSGGTISLKVVGDAIKRVQVGTDKTAAELAIKRLTGELAFMQQAISDNAFMKRAKITDSNKLFWILFFIVSFFDFIISLALGGIFGSVFFFVVLIGSAVFLFYVATEKSGSIAAEFDARQDTLMENARQLQLKINKNRQFVD